jgi:transcriptional regulator with XRE-family HTH domain
MSATESAVTGSVAPSSVGARIRKARHEEQFSLEVLARKLNVSAATLSRIETGKQPIELNFLQSLAEVLSRNMSSFIDDGRAEGTSRSSLVETMSMLGPEARIAVWRQLAERTRTRQAHGRSARNLALEVDELLAQIDFLRAEIELVRTRLK